MGSGYSISFEEFVSLLSENSIITLVESWFDGKLSDGQLVKSSGEILSLQQMHEAIQANSDWQYKIYQAAMDIWR
jgi:hypothetical protein